MNFSPKLIITLCHIVIVFYCSFSQNNYLVFRFCETSTESSKMSLCSGANRKLAIAFLIGNLTACAVLWNFGTFFNPEVINSKCLQCPLKYKKELNILLVGETSHGSSSDERRLASDSPKLSASIGFNT